MYYLKEQVYYVRLRKKQHDWRVIFIYLKKNYFTISLFFKKQLSNTRRDIHAAKKQCDKDCYLFEEQILTIKKVQSEYLTGVHTQGNDEIWYVYMLRFVTIEHQLCNHGLATVTRHARSVKLWFLHMFKWGTWGCSKSYPWHLKSLEGGVQN